MAKLKDGRITFDQDDWLAGLNLQYTSGLTDTPAPEVGKGLSSSSRMNPFRYLGYAAPGFDPTDVTTVSNATAYLRNCCFGFQGSLNYAYFIGSDSKFLGLNIVAKDLDVTHTITGTGAITGSDIASYYSKVGAGAQSPCVFYSYNDAGGGGTWNVGRYRTDSAVFDDDFMSTVPVTPLSPSGDTKPHALKVGSDDILYIADGNKLHAYDGANGSSGTFYDSVLVLPAGYIITSMARVSSPTDYLAVFAYYQPRGNTVSPNLSTSGPAKAFFWDYLSLDPTYIRELNDSVVTSAFEWKGTIGCFTEGKNLVNDGADRNSRLKIWNGGEFETVATFIGDAPINGGVDIVGDSIQWNSGGTIFCYGSPFEGMNVGMNRLGSGTGTTSGVLRSVGGVGGYQVISTGATTSGGLQYMQAGTFSANSSVSTVVVCPEFARGKKGKVRAVRIDFGKTSLSTGCPLSAYIITENGNSSQILSAVSLVDSSNITKWYYNPYNSTDGFPLFLEARIVLQWAGGSPDTDAPVVRRVVIEYEEVNTVNT